MSAEPEIKSWPQALVKLVQLSALTVILGGTLWIVGEIWKLQTQLNQELLMQMMECKEYDGTAKE